MGINTADSRAAAINSIEDCELAFPGEIDAIREWFTWYKAKDSKGNRLPGKSPSAFGFGGQPLDTTQACKVIEETHAAWRRLVLRRVPAHGLLLA